MSEKNSKLISTLGLCARARKLIIGTPMVCERLRSDSLSTKASEQKIYAVLEAGDTSENTHSRIVSKCSFYGVSHYRLEISSAELAHAIGKTGATAAVGVIDGQLWKAVSAHLSDSDSH